MSFSNFLCNLKNDGHALGETHSKFTSDLKLFYVSSTPLFFIWEGSPAVGPRFKLAKKALIFTEYLFVYRPSIVKTYNTFLNALYKSSNSASVTL